MPDSELAQLGSEEVGPALRLGLATLLPIAGSLELSPHRRHALRSWGLSLLPSAGSFRCRPGKRRIHPDGWGFSALLPEAGSHGSVPAPYQRAALVGDPDKHDAEEFKVIPYNVPGIFIEGLGHDGRWCRCSCYHYLNLKFVSTFLISFKSWNLRLATRPANSDGRCRQ